MSLQYVDRCTYSSDDRAWNAYDGSIIDLEPDHFPGIDVNESVQDI